MYSACTVHVQCILKMLYGVNCLQCITLLLNTGTYIWMIIWGPCKATNDNNKQSSGSCYKHLTESFGLLTKTILAFGKNRPLSRNWKRVIHVGRQVRLFWVGSLIPWIRPSACPNIAETDCWKFLIPYQQLNDQLQQKNGIRSLASSVWCQLLCGVVQVSSPSSKKLFVTKISHAIVFVSRPLFMDFWMILDGWLQTWPHGQPELPNWFPIGTPQQTGRKTQ